MTEHIETNKDYLTLMEKSGDLLFFVNADGEIKYATPSVQQVFGFSHNEYLRLNIIDLTHPDDLDTIKNHLKEVRRDQNVQMNFQSRHRNHTGAYHWIEGTFTNMLSEDGINSIQIKFTDISMHKNSIEEKDALVNELNKRNEDLNQFVYIISHNLRTPLSNLIGLINILETEMLDDYNKGIVELFKNSTDRLNETIFDLTQILSLKSNQGVRISNVNIKEVFRKVCGSLTEQISKPDIKITSTFNCEYIFFNKSYLESILLNLMSNSIKYRDYHRDLEICLHLDKDEHNNCILTFKDNGIGIDLESSKGQIFGLYQRFHTHVKGNGVGLYITKSQITSLGGHIDVYSKVNEGTTFKITFTGN